MINVRLLPTFLRELTVARTLPREPEPDLVMDDPEQVAAYAHAGRIDGAMAAAYLFHSARVSQVIAGCEQVLDLGCGPATQLAQIAQLNSLSQFTGVDLSPSMLSDAESHLQRLGIGNVSLRRGDITRLDFLADRSMDAVISTMALHHLPSHQLLAGCFAEISRVLRPGGALYLTDFGRLKSLKSVIFFAYMHAKHQPHLFSLDTERSLRAAFLKEDFEALVAKHFPTGVRVESTFKVPFLVIVKTADRPLAADTRQRISTLYGSLEPRYRRDLNDIRTFFSHGGLKNDPFSPI
jgi:arsenite methyltransferase